MYAITDLERATGFTSNQVRDRLALLSSIFGKDVHRGARGKILVGDDVLAALRRMRELERDGLSPRVAQGEIIREMGNGNGKGEATFAGGGRGSNQAALERENALLREMLEEVKRDRDHWRDLVDRLQLALPSPKPRRWWAWWRPALLKH